MEQPIQLRRIACNGIELNVAVAGAGPALLLVHGWPHTWQVWRPVIPELAATHRVIAPDLRGLGASTRAEGGYDLQTLATDLERLLAELEVRSVSVVGIDAGAPPAFMLAMRRPELVSRLVLIEAVLGPLPGAEQFFAAGPPWWFGFHATPGLAEWVLAGHEAEYLDHFLDSGCYRGVPSELRDAFVEAYTGTESLRCGFEYYRAAGRNAEQLRAAVATGRLRVPTMAIGAGAVGDALHCQLLPIAEELVGELIPDCGHIVPLDRPDVLLELLAGFGV